ncbi:unnamed protein product, partial [marine sediment metagenome]
QRAWGDLWDGDVDPDGVALIEAYTVPEGWRLYLGGGDIDCEVSCIQLVMLIHTPGILGYIRYDVYRHVTINPPIGEVLEAGETLQYHVYNDDVVKRHFSVSLLGIEEKV